MSRFASVNLLLLNLRACWAEWRATSERIFVWCGLLFRETSIVAVSDGDNRIRRLESNTAIQMHVDMFFCKFCECIVSFCKSGKSLNSTLTELLPSNWLPARSWYCEFALNSFYLYSIPIILPLMTSSLYLIFIAHHGKLPMFGLLSSSLFRCHVELWCTNRSLFCVIFFLLLKPILCQCFCSWKG